jgi:hypothetical protein
MVALVLARTASPAELELVTAGGGTIEASIGPPEPSVPTTALLAWVKRCASAVSSYFGRFPVDHVRLNVITGNQGQIGRGMTWGGRRPVIRVFVGRDTKEADFESDWLLTHEMTHLAFPDMAEEHHWIEEGLATYVEPVARGASAGSRLPKSGAASSRACPRGSPAAAAASTARSSGDGRTGVGPSSGSSRSWGSVMRRATARVCPTRCAACTRRAAASGSTGRSTALSPPPTRPREPASSATSTRRWARRPWTWTWTRSGSGWASRWIAGP